MITLSLKLTDASWYPTLGAVIRSASPPSQNITQSTARNKPPTFIGDLLGLDLHRGLRYHFGSGFTHCVPECGPED